MSIIVYTSGDSADISTWSNVPYLFTRTLEEKGYTLHRVDISASPILCRIFNTISYKICIKLFKLKACPIFQRTWLHRFIISRKLKQAAKKYDNADLNLFLSYAFVNLYSRKPNVLWCDWTDRIVIERLGREPKWFETGFLQHEDEVVRSADLVYTMFPACKKHMEELYKREVHYLSRNVVNTVYEGSFSLSDTIRKRKKSQIILFIGRLSYMQAAKDLIVACSELKKQNTDLECHIIGLTAQQLGEDTLPKGVTCHGYLRKNVQSEKEKYYDLLMRARVVVNHTPNWGAYSSIVECMFYGCPIIISPYEDFVENFGETISFGRYMKEHDSLVNALSIFLKDCTAYDDMCVQAHNAVKDYTWSNYVDAFIQSLKENNILN